tara:strand:+ start:984 stop:1325 length:342 start_codon:yes stop_codon:yes gene_type:complete
MINSRQKGARGEREYAKVLTEMGYKSRRGCQFAGGEDSPDVVGGILGTHVEVKRVEKLNIEKAIDQAVRDCGKNVPYVAHRKNGREWLVTLRLSDLKDFARLIHQEMILAEYE